MAWMLAGRIGYSLAQWLTVVLISQQLGAEALGSYSFAVAVCGPVFVFCTLFDHIIQRHGKALLKPWLQSIHQRFDAKGCM
jgi:O-antigen/teichoic acid export membrane protein